MCSGNKKKSLNNQFFWEDIAMWQTDNYILVLEVFGTSAAHFLCFQIIILLMAVLWRVNSICFILCFITILLSWIIHSKSLNRRCILWKIYVFPCLIKNMLHYHKIFILCTFSVIMDIINLIKVQELF